jgi:hypothetical protein
MEKNMPNCKLNRIVQAIYGILFWLKMLSHLLDAKTSFIGIEGVYWILTE